MLAHLVASEYSHGAHVLRWKVRAEEVEIGAASQVCDEPEVEGRAVQHRRISTQRCGDGVAAEEVRILDSLAVAPSSQFGLIESLPDRSRYSLVVCEINVCVCGTASYLIISMR